MKHFYVGICLILACTILSCSPNEELFQTTSSGTLKKQARNQQGRFFFDDDIQHRGIYVNDFENSILGNFEEELNLIDWCHQHDFNEVTLYNISSILNDQYKTALLSSFILRAHFSGIRVSFVAASKEAIIKIKNYQSQFIFPFFKSDALATEYEFWNTNAADVSYEYYQKRMLKTLRQVDPVFSHYWKQQLYISEFKDAAGVYPDEKVLKKVVQHFKKGGGNDQLFFVNYRTNAQNFPTNTSSNHYQRLQKLANVAAQKGVVINVVVLFMTRQDTTPTLFNYFSDTGAGYDFQDAYITYRNGFENSAMLNKEFINLQGYQIYRYSDAKVAKPLDTDIIFDDDDYGDNDDNYDDDDDESEEDDD